MQNALTQAGAAKSIAKVPGRAIRLAADAIVGLSTRSGWSSRSFRAPKTRCSSCWVVIVHELAQVPEVRVVLQPHLSAPTTVNARRRCRTARDPIGAAC